MGQNGIIACFKWWEKTIKWYLTLIVILHYYTYPIICFLLIQEKTVLLLLGSLNYKFIGFSWDMRWWKLNFKRLFDRIDRYKLTKKST